MPHGTLQWALFASLLAAVLLLTRAIWLSAKWDRRRLRLVRERHDRGVEDVCWDFCRETDYLRALNLSAQRLRQQRPTPDRLLKAVE